MVEVASAALIGGSVGYAPNLIVVGIGGSTALRRYEFQRRRTFDFLPEIGYIREKDRHVFPDPSVIGGAPRFRDYVVDVLRPQLAKEYRMDPHDHGIAGHSGGAMFSMFTLFTRPNAFKKYLISSPGNATDVTRLESEYASAHDDLKARVFVAAGSIDMTDCMYTTGASGGVWTATVGLVEALVNRGYPSLELSTAVLPGHTHWSVWPVAYTDGVRALWHEDVRRFSKADVDALLDWYEYLKPRSAASNPLALK
jgi:predicted alpha/beta superfamily hydrolase